MKKLIIATTTGAIVNFFGIEISDAQFDAAMDAARGSMVFSKDETSEVYIKAALNFEAGDVVAPPALWSLINRE